MNRFDADSTFGPLAFWRGPRYYGRLDSECGWVDRVEDRETGLSIRFIRQWEPEAFPSIPAGGLFDPWNWSPATWAFLMSATLHEPFPLDPNAPRC